MSNSQATALMPASNLNAPSNVSRTAPRTAPQPQRPLVQTGDGQEEKLPATEVVLALPYDLEHRGYNLKARSALQCREGTKSPGIEFDQTEIAYMMDISHQRVSIMEKHGLEKLLKRGKAELHPHLPD